MTALIYSQVWEGIAWQYDCSNSFFSQVWEGIAWQYALDGQLRIPAGSGRDR